MEAMKKLFFVAFVVACLLSFGTTVQAAGTTTSVVAISSQALETTPTDGGGEEGGGPCAAAAALGADQGQLEALRALRDNVLAKSPVGRQIVKIYYAQSPAVIAAFEKNPALKNAAKAALDAIIPIAELIAAK